MAQRQAGKVIIAATIAIVGVAVGWRALHRSAPNPSTQSIPAPTPPKEVRTKSAYEIRPTPGTVDQAAAQVANVIRQAPASIAAEAGVTQVQMENLADRITTRLAMVLSGADLSEVVAEARKDGMQWSESTTLTAAAMNRYGSWSTSWLNAPMSLDRSFVRVSDAQRNKKPFTPPHEWENMALRNVLRPRFSDLPDNAKIVELVVPAMIRAYNSSASPNIPVDIGFSYYWSAEKQQWMGVSVTTYCAADNVNRIIPPP